MAQNKHNIVTDEVSKTDSSSAHSTGTGTHARNRHEEERETTDNSAEGLAGRKLGEEKAKERQEGSKRLGESKRRG